MQSSSLLTLAWPLRSQWRHRITGKWQEFLGGLHKPLCSLFCTPKPTRFEDCVGSQPDPPHLPEQDCSKTHLIEAETEAQRGPASGPRSHSSDRPTSDLHGGVYGAVPLAWAYCGTTRLPGSRGQRGSHTQGSIRARSFLCDPPIPSLGCPEDLERNRCVNWCPGNTYGPTKGILSLGTKVAAHGVMTAATLATREHKDTGAEPGGVDVGTGCAACPSRTPTARRPHWPPLFLLSKAVASQFPKLCLCPHVTVGAPWKLLLMPGRRPEA